MPDVVINHLNNMADRSSEDHTLTFDFGSGEELKPVEDTETDDSEVEYLKYMQRISDNYFKVNNNLYSYDPMEDSNSEDDIKPDMDVMKAESIMVEEPSKPTVSEFTSTFDTESDSPDTSIKIEGVDDDVGDDVDVPTTEHSEQSRYRLRPSRALPGKYARKREFGLHLTVKQALEKLGSAAEEAIRKELSQLAVEKKAWHPIKLDLLNHTERKKILPSSMFIKEKYKPDGTFEKIKARLVAGGHRQDKKVYEGKTSSPTVSTTSVFLVAAIAAGERRAVATLDIPGAYLEAAMPADQEPVYMSLDKSLSEQLIKIIPDYLQYKTDRGNIIVRLDKALYGCVQSSKLWYEKITSVLKEIGYDQNIYDQCVMNRKESDGSQSTILFHVDDLMITAKSDTIIDNIIEDIKRYFNNITINRGSIINYLGMVFDYGIDGEVSISMETYLEELLRYSGIEGTSSSPANNNLFKISESKLLDNKDKESYHSLLAKVAYLSKRTRPDCLLTCNFLATRVNVATVEDNQKLERMIRYLRGTKDLKLTLRMNFPINIIASIDASYGIHSDMKSHSGVMITIGSGAIFAMSTKQKLNSKSSTEAELIAVSDGLNQVLWTRNFIIEQGYSLNPAKVYQDNKSTIHLMKDGQSNSVKTRHIAIRFFFVKDRVESKEINISYQCTEEMIADLLTKPLQGTLFRKHRASLLGMA